MRESPTAIQVRGQGSYALSGVYVNGWGAIAGTKESQGPLAGHFDEIWEDNLAGKATWEQAERELWLSALRHGLNRAQWPSSTVDLVLGGDLLNQLYATNFAGRAHAIPLLGLFAACATFTEGVGLGALLIAGGGPRRVMVGASSHHLASERQFRFPIELGYQRTPTASWTATAAGAIGLSRHPSPITVAGVTFGRVIDRGSADPMDMATAMTPAAHDCLMRHLSSFSRVIDDYDRIFTGDLGLLGTDILRDLMSDAHQFAKIHEDCGRILYGPEQDTHNGGSGAGCAAAVFSGHIVSRILDGSWRRVLLIATGALFSPTSYQQGETIPCIAHAVEFERSDRIPS